MISKNENNKEDDFLEEQEESLKLFNPIKAWNNGYFLTQHKKDIKNSAEKGRKKLNDLKNRIKEEKENINYTFQPQVNKKYNDKIKKDFNERQEESLEKKENNKKKKQSEIAKNWTFKPQITEETDDVGKVRQMFSGNSNNSNNSNNQNSYVNKYFVNKNNYNQQDVYYRLYTDAQDRKARRKKLPSDYLYRNNTVIDNNSTYQFEKKIINKPKRWKNNSYYISHKN